MINLPQLSSDTACAVHRASSAITSEIHYAAGQLFLVSMESDPVPVELSHASALRLLAQWGGTNALVDAEPGTRAELGVALLKSSLRLLAEIDHF